MSSYERARRFSQAERENPMGFKMSESRVTKPSALAGEKKHDHEWDENPQPYNNGQMPGHIECMVPGCTKALYAGDIDEHGKSIAPFIADKP